MRRGLALGGEVGGQDHLLDHAVGGALSSSLHADVLRADAVERAERPISTKYRPL
jgi:hypothetical protein